MPARITVALAVLVILCLPYWYLGEVRVELLYSELGLMYQRNQRNGGIMTIPWITRVMLPCAPVAWWSLIAPFCIAIGIAIRISRRVTLVQAIALLIGAAIVVAVVFAATLPWIKMLSPMGFPIKGPPGAREIVANLIILSAAAGWLAWSIRCGYLRFRASEAPNKSE